MRYSKVCLLLIFLILPSVSALEFDNYGRYNSENREMVIENAFGFGREIARMRLISEPTVFVASGQEVKIAEIDIVNAERNYPDAFSLVKLYNLRDDNREINREMKMKYAKVTGQNIIHDEQCEVVEVYSQNRTRGFDSRCHPITYNEDIVEWIEFTEVSELPEGRVKIGLYSQVFTGDKIEWIPTWFGVEIDEWAVWVADLNTDLEIYYYLNTTSGIETDSRSKHYNITNITIGVKRGETGISNNSFYVNGSKSVFETNFSTAPMKNAIVNSSKGAISIWFNWKGNATNSQQMLFQFNNLSQPQTQLQIMFDNTTLTQRFQVALTNTSGHNDWIMVSDDLLLRNVTLGMWNHIVLNHNGTSPQLYYNGTLIDTTFTDSSNISMWLGGLYNQVGQGGLSGARFSFGAQRDRDLNQLNFNGTIDEVGIWNRSLEAHEVMALYNNGTGIFFNPFSSSADNSLTVTLISPAHTNSDINSTVNFTASIVYGSGLKATNATAWIYYSNGSLFRNSNSSAFGLGAGQTIQTNITVSGIPPSNFTWNIGACGFVVSNSSVFCAFSGGNRTYLVKERILAENYSSTAILGNTEFFQLNITIPDTGSLLNTYLVYNNTFNIVVPELTGGNNYSLTKNLDVEGFLSGANVTFLWSILYSNGFNSNSTSRTQEVYIKSFDNCTSFNHNILNFTLHDEDERTFLNGTIEVIVNLLNTERSSIIASFNRSYTVIDDGKSSARVCTTDLESEFSLDYQTKYFSNTTLYAVEYKFARAIPIDNSTATQNVKLYDLVDVRNTPFKIILQSQTLDIIEDAIIDIQRQYIPINQFISIESPLTNNEGEAISHLVAKEIYYNFIVTKNGTLLGTFNNNLVQCQNEVTGDCRIILNLIESTSRLPDFENYGNISATFTWLQSSRTLNFNFLSQDNLNHRVAWNVSKFDNYGNNTICTNQITGTGSSFTCVIPHTYGNTSILAEIYSDGIFLGRSTFSLGLAAEDIWGGTKVILGLVMYSTLTLLFIGHPVTIIIGAIIGMSTVAAFRIVDGGTFLGNASILLWFVIAGFIIIHYMRNKS